jgi:hypothetical protein
VLAASGWLAIYDHYFLGEMEDVPSFRTWARKSFAVRYPTPPRGRHSDATTETPTGFHRLGDHGYVDVAEMTHRGLVDYVLTQSNTTVAVTRRSCAVTFCSSFGYPAADLCRAGVQSAKVPRISSALLERVLTSVAP